MVKRRRRWEDSGSTPTTAHLRRKVERSRDNLLPYLTTANHGGNTSVAPASSCCGCYETRDCSWQCGVDVLQLSEVIVTDRTAVQPKTTNYCPNNLEFVHTKNSMSDVRALLAAERQSRRISHPNLTYSKTGALTCNICNLNIKSEQLWPGHLKSLNHRKNAQKHSEASTRPAKRKIDRVDDMEEEERNYEVDSRKKPKSMPQVEAHAAETTVEQDLLDPATLGFTARQTAASTSDAELQPNEPSSVPQPKVHDAVDEDEWAAFERDVAPLAQLDYTSATIVAAPVSAAEMVEQQKTNIVQQREDEAEAEKEDESRRMEEEFDVMEEMEDRVKHLRARREALRTKDPTTVDHMDTSIDKTETYEDTGRAMEQPHSEEPSDNDDEEVDDWYS